LVERVDFDSTRRFRSKSSGCCISSTTTEGQTENSEDDNQGKDTSGNTTNKGKIQWGCSQDTVETTLTINTCTEVGLISGKGVIQNVLITSVGLSINHPDVVGLLIDPFTEGSVDADTISGTVVRALWRDKVGGRNASIEGQVSTDIIFDTLSLDELLEWFGSIRAPSTSKTKCRSGSQTRGTVRGVQA